MTTALGGRPVAALVAIVALLAAPGTLRAQQVMTAKDLTSLTAPPPDHQIAYGEDPLQFGNLRLPKGAGPFPVVVLVHGGCWLSEYDITHLGALEQALADSGFAVWSLEYRRVGDPGGEWPNSFRDVARGADHLRALARDHPLDLTRVIASGHSAGGAFAVWLAMRPRIPRSSPLFAPTPLPVHGVLGLAPAADLEGVEAAGTCGGVINKLMGGSPAEHPDRYAAVSPMQLLPLDMPELFVLGARDVSWSRVARAYESAARAAGDTTLTILEVPEAGHFELVAPATAAWPAVIGAFRQLLARIAP